MKSLLANRLANVASAFLLAVALSSSAQAGPFADWWYNNTQYGYANTSPLIPLTPVTSGYGTYPNYAYNAYTGYPNTSYSPVLPAGLHQTNAAFLPTGGYASQYYRAPTTYYRPVTSLDPNTGTTVTSLQPCASYQYQAQRIPLLVPSWSNYAYGGYGASSLQNRWPPITAPVVGSAAGQSSLSIASGFGTYGTSPVVQVPMTGAPLYALPNVPASQTLTSGYGGIYYGQPLATPSTLGLPANNVVPAAAWAAPSLPQYSSTPVNGTAYSSTYGGYFGSVPQTFAQPATMTPGVSSTTSGYLPSGASTTVNGSTMTPIGPPVTSSYPSQSNVPNTTFGAMPGSMGQPVMPSAVSPSIQMPSSSTMPPVMPSTPAPSSIWSPSPNTSNLYDSESTIAPSLHPSVAENRKPEVNTAEAQPRFKLRGVERTPQAANPSNEVPTIEVPKSPWANQPGESYQPANGQGGASESTNEPANDFELKLNMESLRPIPAPRNFDATPDWKPALLNAHDQTAAHVKVRTIDGQPSDGKAYREVRFLSGRGFQPQQNPNDIRATIRPIQKSELSTGIPSASSDNRRMDTSGWTSVSGR